MWTLFKTVAKREAASSLNCFKLLLSAWLIFGWSSAPTGEHNTNYSYQAGRGNMRENM